VKRVGIHHEGGVAGPFGRAAGEAMELWRLAMLDAERSRQRGDGLPTVFLEGIAHMALIRTLEGRRN